MNPQELQEHIAKEALKQYVESCHNYPDYVKRDLKLLVHASKSPEELARNILAYFAGHCH